MKLINYFASLDGALVINKYSGIINVLLAACLSVTLIAVFNKDEKIILQPETLGSEAWITKTAASQSYKEAWGLFLAQMSGNITPENVDFIVSRLKPLMSPKVYTGMVDAMYAQAIAIKDDRITVRFEPQSVEYEPETNKVFVFGSSFLKSGAATEVKQSRTFEYEINIRNYAPVILGADNYEGNPKTLQKLASEKKSKGDEK
jgi:conjugal transfer pilus assembly protein TraE